MKAVIQRVSRAEVCIDGQIVGKIGRGFVVLLGIAKGDGESELQWMVDKICNLRIFPNYEGKFDLSLLDIKGQALIVSQFTLFGDCRKGRRPGFESAAHPAEAEPLYLKAIQTFQEKGVFTQQGRFGAMMDVELVNDGPVTLILETSS